MDYQSKIMNCIEEQVSVKFTGKVNILATFNHQYLGHILFKNGEIFNVVFQGLNGLKAFYHLALKEHSLESFNYVIEPEVVEDKERHLHFPIVVIKNKMADVITRHSDSLKYRPPENVKILIDAEFMEDTLPVTQEEYQVLETLTEWSQPFDIYQHCQLLDYEITSALVSLRKKNALKIVGARNNDDDSL
jgi:hypothetical protein